MSESIEVPVLVFLVEGGRETEGNGFTPELHAEGFAALQLLLRQLRGAARTQPSLQQVDLMVAIYDPQGQPEQRPEAKLHPHRVLLTDAEADAAGTSLREFAVARFGNPELALVALANWLLKRPEVNSPVLVLHLTGGRFKCCAELERAAGTVKMACDFHGAPGVFYNVLINSEVSLSFPSPDLVAGQSNPLIKTLFRMSSPTGKLCVQNISGLCDAHSASARCFEAVPSSEASRVGRFAGDFFTDAARSQVIAGLNLQTRAFLLPKQGESLENCEDVVSIHRNQRRFVISDGATTASYSAEWARALCRHAVETPPPVFPGAEGPLSEQDQHENAERMRSWLKTVLAYWAPEVPWERLVRASVFNKAQEGSGASLAGIEAEEAKAGAGVRFRGWALGDSCVIHLREGQIISSKPIAASAEFTHAPALLMTRPGYERKYVEFWQSWEVTLTQGDMLLLATDALCEYVLKVFENGRQAELFGWLEGLSANPVSEAWLSFEAFISARRNDGQLKNDDVGLILIRLE